MTRTDPTARRAAVIILAAGKGSLVAGNAACQLLEHSLKRVLVGAARLLRIPRIAAISFVIFRAGSRPPMPGLAP